MNSDIKESGAFGTSERNSMEIVVCQQEHVLSVKVLSSVLVVSSVITTKAKTSAAFRNIIKTGDKVSPSRSA